MWSSLKMRSRSARVACTSPCGSRARMPKWMAVEEYQTRTSVLSSAAMPSTGWKREKPVSRAADCQTGSSSTPSTVMLVSCFGGVMRSCRARPS